MIHPSNRVRIHTAVQSNKAKDEVAKLCHASRYPFQIILGIDHGSYIVQK